MSGSLGTSKAERGQDHHSTAYGCLVSTASRHKTPKTKDLKEKTYPVLIEGLPQMNLYISLGGTAVKKVLLFFVVVVVVTGAAVVAVVVASFFLKSLSNLSELNHAGSP